MLWVIFPPFWVIFLPRSDCSIKVRPSEMMKMVLSVKRDDDDIVIMGFNRVRR